METTIFACFKDENLAIILKKWAENNGHKIYWGDPEEPDIIAIPSFCKIIDREYLSKNMYELYLNYCEEVNSESQLNYDREEIKDDGTCIIIDDLRNLELPMLDSIHLIKRRNEKYCELIIQLIDIAQKT